VVYAVHLDERRPYDLHEFELGLDASEVVALHLQLPLELVPSLLEAANVLHAGEVGLDLAHLYRAHLVEVIECLSLDLDDALVVLRLLLTFHGYVAVLFRLFMKIQLLGEILHLSRWIDLIYQLLINE
jgi:hypothetical protein